MEKNGQAEKPKNPDGMGKKGILLAFAGVLLVLAVALCVVLAGLLLPRSQWVAGEDSCLYIDRDDTVDSVKIKSRLGWRMGLCASLLNYHVRTGRYETRDLNALSLFRRLRNGQQEPIQLIIPSVRTMDRMAHYLASHLMMDSTEVVRFMADSSQCALLGYPSQQLPALFVPNTYEVYWDTSIDHFMHRMLTEHNHFWQGEREQLAKACGLTPVEVCTLASIVDEETANKAEKPDMFIAGPAFNAGRYGYACANVALAVQEELGIPVLTGMYVENPGADLKNKVLIYETANSAAGMRKAAPGMAKLALKLMKGEEIGASCEEGYMPNGIRKNFFDKERGSKRAVDMLLKKLNGEHFVTEYPMPSFDRVAPNPAIKDLSKATIALCTSGGIVPKGNPDHIESSSASHYGEYSLDGFDKLSSADHETAHGGYDTGYANDDPNRVLPVDVMREFEREGKIGKLHNLYYATVGNGTAVASAKAFAAEYAQKLKKAGVDGVIMTST